MSLLEKLVLFCSGLLFLLQVLALGENYEKSKYSENSVGRLFSIGMKKYVTLYNTGGKEYADVDEKKEMATRLYIRIIRDGSMTHGVILSAEEKDQEKCANKTEDYGSGYSAQYLECPGFSVEGKEGNLIALAPYQNEAMFKFMFSPATLSRLHGFRIYNEGKCIAANSNGQLFADECEYIDTIKKANQIFSWVDDTLFSKDYNPMGVLDQTTNPADPYYDEYNKNINTAWIDPNPT
ncbi:uncharacterized protein NEMAJ01_1971 [Nematocida major]|uniref:uncharacterized protein n=1 Tax=Nematocida major TaxID=1912982 RepID=UPI0020088C24|nr:uncharacterized protein NEMAJ01_1971 [Nematocida major]KAH9387075.1 hypothetical protein NEMAJ01_1971 [Nematocida major]